MNTKLVFTLAAIFFCVADASRLSSEDLIEKSARGRANASEAVHKEVVAKRQAKAGKGQAQSVASDTMLSDNAFGPRLYENGF